MPTLYDFDRAPSPRRARTVLAEKGIAHARVTVDLATGEQLGGAYRAINPRATVPALVLDDGTVLTDNAGILAWADAAYPDPPLLGTTPVERAAVASWIARIEQDGFAAVAEAMRNTAPAMKDRALPGPDNHAQIAELGARGLARAHAFFAELDAHLATRDFIAVDHFSAADIAGVVVVDFARVIRWRIDAAATPHLTRWRTALAARASIGPY